MQQKKENWDDFWLKKSQKKNQDKGFTITEYHGDNEP